MSVYGNMMNVIDFQNRFGSYYIFSLQDIRKSLPDFSYRQLDRWEKKGYLRKIRRGYYMLGQQEVNQSFLFLVANKIYAPSYISLQSALKYYGLIPEEVFSIVSVSSRKTTQLSTPVGNFSYRRIKPGLFWGYRLVTWQNRGFLIAEPEKAILDFLYLHPQLTTSDDFLSLRISTDMFVQHVDLKRFRKYLEQFSSQALTRRCLTFLATFGYD